MRAVPWPLYPLLGAVALGSRPDRCVLDPGRLSTCHCYSTSIRLEAPGHGLLGSCNVGVLSMELFSSAWWAALGAIILIDLVLAGDNAIVIALAARNLPAHLQRKAIMWGTVGAIAVRTLMTLVVVWLLKIPGLMLVGGLGLVWIAYKLLVDDGNGHEEHGAGAATFMGAMKTIIVADALMGVDNVLGVAGAAHGNMLLVVLGLLISVPIVIFGSSIVLVWVQRYPIIIKLGAAVLAFTAAKMIVGEPLLDPLFDPEGLVHTAARWTTYGLCIAGVLLAGSAVQKSRSRTSQDESSHSLA
jgi:YjbE family integral membrane protein